MLGKAPKRASAQLSQVHGIGLPGFLAVAKKKRTVQVCIPLQVEQTTAAVVENPPKLRKEALWCRMLSPTKC